MARTRRTTPATRQVTARTAARRARKRVALEQTRQSTRQALRGVRSPETMGQARTWQRKCLRYELAGLCDRCASAAAWGHAEGFGALEKSGRLPCAQCQLLVDKFPTPGPRGAKWRKILTKLEYMNEEELGTWLDAHAPD